MKRKIFSALLSSVILLSVSCSKDENRIAPGNGYKVAFESKASASYIQQITFSQSKGVKSTLNNLPSIWNNTTDGNFSAGDSVFIQVKATPTKKDSINNGSVSLSVKTFSADSSKSNVKFASTSVKNADGSIDASLGFKLK